MIKKCTVKIDDREYAIAEDLIELLDLMTHYGFFRFIENGQYLSVHFDDLTMLHPDISGIKSDETGKKSNGAPSDSPSPHISRNRFVSDLLKRLHRSANSSESKFVLELFFSALGCFFRGLDLRECFLESSSSNQLTEGSNFSEAVENDLGVNRGHVKKKMKKPVIATAKNVKIDLIVEKVSREWLEWSTEKYPFLAKRMNQEGFYNSLMKTKKTLEMSSEQIEAMFEWIKKDNFWSEHAISPRSLLTDSRNGIKKVDNILSQMRNKIVRENPFLDFDENWQNPFD